MNSKCETSDNKNKKEEETTSPNEFICQTKVTVATIRKALLDHAGIAEDKQKKFVLQDWTAVQIGVGQGFLSHIIRVCLTWEPSDAKLPTVVVLKVPTTQSLAPIFDEMLAEGGASKEHRETSQVSFQDVFLPLVHANECHVYNDFNQTGGPKATPTPKVYYTTKISKDHPGLIIMEDLSKLGCLASLIDGLNLHQLLNIAESLASLHAYSFEHEAWKQDLREVPKEEIDKFGEMLPMGLKQLESQRPDYFEGKISPLMPFCTAEYLYSTFSSFEELGIPSVLVHGDLWTNNMIFEKSEIDNTKAGNRLLAIIDWQTARCGSIADDFGRLFVMSCSGELRRAECENVLKHYYDTLCSMMKDRKPPFGFDTVLKAYDKVFIASMLGFVPGLHAFEKMPLVEGPNKEQNIETIYKRGRDIVDDVLKMINE